MNIWTEKSIELANQRDYLDQLYKIYPMANNLKRELSDAKITNIKNAFLKSDNLKLIELLLKEKLFPVKDSYVAYLRRDKTALARNPKTINRLAGMIYDLGFENTIDNMSKPKETNRQIGPLFRNWLQKKSLGVNLTSDTKNFINSEQDLILDLSDVQLMLFAKENLGYNRNKGLDFIAKFNNIIVLGESKFLTDFGGHQNAQFEDALTTLRVDLQSSKYKVIKIAILDGVLYIKSKNKFYKTLQALGDDEVVISSLLLRDFLYSL